MAQYKELQVAGLIEGIKLKPFGIETHESLGVEIAISMILNQGWELVAVSSSERNKTYHFVKP